MIYKIIIRKAKPIDAVDIVGLITKEPSVLPRSPQEVRRNISNFFVAWFEGEVVGCVAFENYNPRAAEIRTLCVKKDYRKKGIGKLLVERAFKRGHKGQEIFVTTRSKKFFEKLGFKAQKRDKYILFKNK